MWIKQDDPLIDDPPNSQRSIITKFHQTSIHQKTITAIYNSVSILFAEPILACENWQYKKKKVLIIIQFCLKEPKRERERLSNMKRDNVTAFGGGFVREKSRMRGSGLAKEDRIVRRQTPKSNINPQSTKPVL